MLMAVILYAIPFFFLLIAIELMVDHWRGTGFYRLNDAINSLSMGILSRLTNIIKAIVPFTVYVFVHQQGALFVWPDTAAGFALAFVLYDFFYYWNHRMGHETNLFWASHVVHHSSEEYNLTTALRQTSGSLFNWVFFLPLALLGVDPVTFVTIAALNLVYQFWVHTRFVPKLGWFEYVFVSPSNHRVHHAQNEIYLDRNYGGVFILWDRLFGTFQEELDEQPPIYGVRKPLASWNPIWANLQVYSQVFKDMWRTRRWRDKFAIWFKPPAWRPADVAESDPIELADLSQFSKFDIPLSGLTKGYVFLQHLVNTLLAVWLLLNLSTLSVIEQLMAVFWLLFAATNLGWIMEQRPFAKTLEWIKLLVLIVAVVLQPINLALSVIGAVFLLLSAALLVGLHRESQTELKAHLATSDH